MRLCLSKDSLSSNHHGTQRKGDPWNNESIRGWTFRIVRLETFRRLSTGTEAIESLIGRRLWLYAPSGRCWHVDVYLMPKIKKCEQWPLVEPGRPR